MRGKGFSIAGAVLLAGIGMAAISWWHGRPMANGRGPSRASAAVVAPAGEITLAGAIRPQHVTGVGSVTAGNIDALLAEVGDQVYEGEVLARVGATGLESAHEAAAQAVDRAQEQVLRAERVVSSAMLEAVRADAAAQRSRAEFERVEKLFDRQKTLLAAGATPRLTYQRVERDFDGAQAEHESVEKAARSAHDQVDEANRELAAVRQLAADKSRELQDSQSALEATEVQSPVDGVVVGRNGAVGRAVSEAGNDLFQIATDMYALEVPLTAPVTAANRIRPGQPALVLILDMQSAGIPGTVKSVEGSAVVVEFTGSLPDLRPGMRADVRLKLE